MLADLPKALREILSREKQFRDGSVLKSVSLNRLGLLPARMAGAHLAKHTRIALAKQQLDTDLARHAAFFREHGFVAISEFMPLDVLARIRDEVQAILREDAYDIDHFDGPTRVRRRRIRDSFAPACNMVAMDPRVLALIRAVSGFVIRRAPMGLELITHGGAGHDGNKVTHSDTFHPTLKLWYFIHDVSPEQGSLAYYPGTHRLSLSKLRWAYRCGMFAARSSGHHGSFRPAPDDMRALGAGEPVQLHVRANTFVLLDTHGFHRRGEGTSDINRAALWASIRPNPFILLPAQVTRQRLYNP